MEMTASVKHEVPISKNILAATFNNRVIGVAFKKEQAVVKDYLKKLGEEDPEACQKLIDSMTANGSAEVGPLDNGKTYTVAGVADTTGKDLCTIAVNGNITVKADDVTVVAVPKLAVKSASWTANTVVINFNDGELCVNADKAASYTAPTGGSIAAVEVSGNTVTLTIADVLVAAGSTVKVGTDAGLAAETTITMAADGTGTF